eukprot:GHVH01001765.1.p1 GENE.GHVH01001765.1~~GHVH01001765.1.p1  ORF type:complete len:318 (+),score=49.03 GHVH01001765.1:112-1065(+)
MESLDKLSNFIDGVLDDHAIRFVEDGCHGHAYSEERQVLMQAPVEVGMEDGYEIGCHMLGKISNLNMFETQDDNLRGSIKNALGYEGEKVFEVVDSDTGYPAMIVKESSNFIERNCVPSKCRPFRFTIFSRASSTVLLPAAQLNKGCSMTCVNKMMKVTSSDGRRTIGYIAPSHHCCRIQFTAYDRKQRELFQIHGSKFQLSSVVGKLPLPGFKRVIFNALDDRGHRMGMIANEWGGTFRELLGDADDYTVTFGKHMDSDTKLMMLATAFYLDMRYFTSCCSFSLRDCLIKRYTPAPVVKTMKYAPVAVRGLTSAKR